MRTRSCWNERARVGGASCCTSQDRGYASSLWLGALQHYDARFVLRWRHQYRSLCEGKSKVSGKIAQGKKAWGSRGLWDARRRLEDRDGLCPTVANRTDVEDVQK